MRYRERTNSSSAGVFYRGKYCADSGCPNTKTVTFTGMNTHEAMLDENHSNFKRLSAEGEVFFSPMYQEYLLNLVEPTYWTMLWDDGTYTGETGYDSEIFNCVPKTPILTNSSSASAMDAFLSPYESERNVAIAQAWANVDISELAGLASLGELPETLRWIASLYRRGIGILSMFKARSLKMRLKRDFGRMSAKDYADALSDFWLEFRYAVRPLIFEMEQVINALESEGYEPRRTARGFHDVEDTSIETGTWALATYTMDWEQKTTRESVYRAGVLYSIDGLTAGLTELLGLDQPLEAVWELTKMSFIMDWFLNVGDVLSAHTISGDLTPLGSWIVEEHVFKVKKTYSEVVSSDTEHTLDSSRSEFGSQESTHVVKRRLVGVEPPYIPSISVNLDWAKVVDLAAIARSIYRAFK